MERRFQIVGLLLCLMGAPGTADAAIQWLTLEGRINSVNDNLGGAFTTTDRLRFTFGYDPTTADISSSSDFGTYPGAVSSWTIQVLRAGSPIYTATLTNQNPTQVSVSNFSSHDAFGVSSGGDNLDGPAVNGHHVRSASTALQYLDTSTFTSDDMPPADFFLPIEVPNQHSMRVFFGAAPQGNYPVGAIMDSGAVPEPGALASVAGLVSIGLLRRRRAGAHR